MSDLTDRIASEHQPVWSGIVAERAEQAVREQIASEMHKWAAVEEEHGRDSTAEIWREAADIARGRVMRAITIRQPWAWAVIHADKTVENRSRNIAGDYRGPVAIHAGLKIDEAGQHDPLIREAWTGELALAEDLDRPTFYYYVPWRKAFSCGRIIGVADLVDAHYVDGHSERWDAEAERSTTCSPWAHHGPIWHMVFANPRPLACPIPARGQVGLWTLPDDIEQAVRRQL